LLIALSSIGQEKKLDRIIKKDYTVIECNISKMSDKTVEYSLPGESLVISVDVSQIAKIDFASGRSQTFDQNLTSQESPSSSAPDAQTIVPPHEYQVAFRENTIAVLPVPFMNSATMAASEEMAKFAQNDIYSKLIAKSANIAPLTVQDLRTTNGLLHKAGIDSRSIDEIAVEELLNILGVDHIVAAKISYTEKDGYTSSTSTAGQVKADDNKVKGGSVSTTTQQTVKTYYYTVYLDMYKKTDKIFTQTRKPVFNNKDSWIDAVTYLLKKSPIYTK
jgi:hypothetical protein